MRPESAKYLRDMLDAAHAIQRYSKDRKLDEYLQTPWLRDAVNWNFCVIGEAMTQLEKLDSSTAQRITDYWKIRGLRNQLIHGYGAINHRITWNIVEAKLPTLVMELEQLLGK